MTKNKSLIEGFPTGEFSFVKGSDGKDRLVMVGMEGLLMTMETFKECQEVLMEEDKPLRLLLYYEPPRSSSE